MDKPFVWEDGDRVFIVGPIAPVTPGAHEIAEFAFADALRSAAPNDKLLWFSGQYTEADTPNRNGQLWTADDLALKHLTPRLMPVTVMHDPATAVGLIADTRLLTPEKDKVERARIDTMLALWGHRFPDIAEEALHNHKAGTLMQSMEAHCPSYECPSCDQVFVKMPGGAERAQWCEHLKSARMPVRRLRGDFVGTGLIFGTRSGAVGANPKAYLDVAEFQAEVAEFHERAKTGKTRRAPKVDEITIKRSEYDELKAEAAKAVTLGARVNELEAAEAAKADLEKANEKLEIELEAAKKVATDEKAAREKLEETARAASLSSERLSKLGDAFTGKLSENIRTRLAEQARSLSDEDWTARLEELAELTGVKPDEASAASTGTFTDDETARMGGLGAGAPAGSVPTAKRSAVMDGLFRLSRPEKNSTKSGK